MLVLEIRCAKSVRRPSRAYQRILPTQRKKKRKILASAKERDSKFCVLGVKTISPHVKYQEVYQLTSCRQQALKRIATPYEQVVANLKQRRTKLYCTFTICTVLYESILAPAVVRSMRVTAHRVNYGITWVVLCSTLVDIWRI